MSDQLPQPHAGLCASDVRFLRSILSDSYDEVAEALALRPSHWRQMTAADEGVPSRMRRVLALVRMLWRFMRAAPSSRGFAVVCCEHVSEVPDTRPKYFARFLPDVAVEYVTARTRPARGISWRELLGICGQLLPVVLGATCSSSELSGQYVRIAEYCLTAWSHVLASSGREAYLLRLYQQHTPVLAGFLRDRGVLVHDIAGSGLITSAELAIPADSIKLSHRFQVEQALALTASRNARTLDVWGPAELPEMEAHYGCGAGSGQANVVALYTQGWWLRKRMGTAPPEIAAAMMEVESQMWRAVAAVADSNPCVSMIHFPHPIERRHFARTGERGPWPELQRPDVRSSYGAMSTSVADFAAADVGVAGLSDVAFDRLYMGFKTLIYSVDEQRFEQCIGPSLSSVVSRTRGELEAGIAQALGQSSDAFMSEHFNGLVREWRPDEVALAGMANRTRVW